MIQTKANKWKYNNNNIIILHNNVNTEVKVLH